MIKNTYLEYKKNIIHIIMKYIALIFSDKKGKPSETGHTDGIAGLTHIKHDYLKLLPLYAKYLNRKAVLPPPWTSLWCSHNNANNVDKNNTWNTYYDMDNIENVENNPPFTFKDNGDIDTNLSIEYYPSNTNIELLKNDADIIALVNFNDDETGLKLWSHLPYYPFFNKYNLPSYNTSISLKKYANIIISNLNLKNFIFIHSRRTDYLHNHILAPPNGTEPYTSPEFISNYIKKYQNNKNIFIATDEKDINYKKRFYTLMPGYNIIFEEHILKFLTEDILKDNYCIFLILNEIASVSKINITTISLRLGNRQDLSLNELFKKNKNIQNRFKLTFR